MAVFRIEKTGDFTVMSNHHLRNANLSLKAKGLLSLMLSLPEKWDYTTKGLAAICKDGVDSICAGVRELEEHGYVRDGNLYTAVRPNEDTIVFFCHFGLECVLLSHLLHISPVLLWHGACAAPTSVTTLTTEERREGKVHFRMIAFGDISHLYAAGRDPSFSARFCETYSNTEQRHD